MTKDEPRRMQEVPARREPNQLAPAAASVRVVANDRVPDRSEMHSDLVGAPSVQVRAQQVRGVEAGQPIEIRPCRSSTIDDCHTLSVSRIAGDRLLDGQPVAADMSPGERSVAAGDRPAL